MKKALIGLLGISLLISLSACSSGTVDGSQIEELEQRIDELEQENAELREQLGGPETPADNNEAAPAEENGTSGEESTLAIGDVAELGDFSVSVTGFDLSTRIDVGYSSYYSPDEGNQYGIVSMSVTNNGTEAQTFWPSFSLGDDINGVVIYDNTYEYTSTQLLTYDEDLHDKFLNPLTSAEGNIVFTLPDSVVNGDGPLAIELSYGDDVATFALK